MLSHYVRLPGSSMFEPVEPIVQKCAALPTIGISMYCLHLHSEVTSHVSSLSTKALRYLHYLEVRHSKDFRNMDSRAKFCTMTRP
jgi:hypothetical protein